MMRKLLERLGEPSTWRGITWMVTALGITIDPSAIEYIATIGMSIAGLIGVLTSDKKGSIGLSLGESK